jgi:hypothetical protein
VRPGRASTMASSSSTSLLQPVSEKLSKNNNSLWKVQVHAAVRGARLQRFLFGESKVPGAKIFIIGSDGKELKKPNPAHEDWEAMDQQVLSYLLSSLNKETWSQVSNYTTTAFPWVAIEGLFGS